METYVNIDDADPLIAKHAIYWVLSSEAYKQNRRKNIDGWEALILNLDSIVYGKDNNIIVAFKGTNPLSVEDIYNDLQIGLNVNSCDFSKAGPAKELVTLVQQKFPGKIISLTGHSLGGATARCAGDATNLLSVTFNAAAPPFKKTETSQNSVNYHIVMDIISAWQYPNTIRIDKGYRPPRPSIFGMYAPTITKQWKFVWNMRRQLLPAHSIDAFKKYNPGRLMLASQENKLIDQWWKSVPYREIIFGIKKYNPVR